MDTLWLRVPLSLIARIAIKTYTDLLNEQGAIIC